MRVRIQQIFELLLLLLIESTEPSADAISRMLLRASERAALAVRQCFLQAEDPSEVACRPRIGAQRISLMVAPMGARATLATGGARQEAKVIMEAAQQVLVLERMLCRIGRG
jgi:hypothetical protein